MKKENEFTFTLDDLHPEWNGAGDVIASPAKRNDYIFGNAPVDPEHNAEANAARIIVGQMLAGENVGPSQNTTQDNTSVRESTAVHSASSMTPIFEPEVFQAPPTNRKKDVSKKRSRHTRNRHGALRVFIRVLIVLLETILLLVGGLYGVMYVLAKGPSDTARSLFVRSVRETSAIGFLANLYFTDDEIAEIEAKSTVPSINTDVSLVSISENSTNSNGADAWGYVDEDGDGIILVDVKGEGYTGYMMIVLDPSRVICATVPSKYGYTGYTVEEMVQNFDAVAGINASGFEDKNGTGDGSIPEHLVIYQGKVAAAGGIGGGFVGLDSNYVLHVGFNSSTEVLDADIQYGCCYGPYLVINGEGVDPSTLASGINPRTAIGQRSDGAILFLVIDGRQVISLGATYEDEMNIMLEFGAVNACNLDGGSSSMMYYNGAYVNNCASVIGIRPVPTAFVVLKEGVRSNG